VLSDLAAAYQAAVRGAAPALPTPSTTYRAWVRALNAYGETPSAKDEVGYWRTTADAAAVADAVGRLIRQAPAAGPGAPARAVDPGRLDRATTRALLDAAGRTGAGMETLVLTGAALAAADVTGQGRVALRHETHGRHDFPGAPPLDRVVGWFTSLYPLAVDVADGPARALAEVAATAAGVPHRGLAYQLLAGRDVPLVTPALTVNYLGARGGAATGRDGAFAVSDWSAGPAAGAGIMAASPISLDCSVGDGRLAWSVGYDPALVPADLPGRLAERLGARLADLAAAAAGLPDGSLKPVASSREQTARHLAAPAEASGTEAGVEPASHLADGELDEILGAF
jgi:hypothetical protein